MSSSEDRRARRRQKREKRLQGVSSLDGSLHGSSAGENLSRNKDMHLDERASLWLANNEDELLKFTAKVNKTYQEKLKKDAPFMTFVLCGMQSAGKSTIMERFMSAVLNIVQEGTGTRCPLDTTCIHDERCEEPKCDLWGEDLCSGRGDGLSVAHVFEAIVAHNRRLGQEDRFSSNPLHLTYRSKAVQNMRFVDTPGIISNKSSGVDNRDEIKKILQSEMQKPNTKLCVLLEPKEFATNSIIDFCDETLGKRDDWLKEAIFLMTKFDKQLEDSRTASKANAFFKEFHNNDCYPHPVITPTLAKEDLPPKELFEKRRQLLKSADEEEDAKFKGWLSGHELYREENGDEHLHQKVEKQLGFGTAKTVMRSIMLRDTAKRLPEVLKELRAELDSRRKQKKIIEEKLKFTDAAELRSVVLELVFELQDHVTEYLDGNLDAALKFPERLQTLDDEIDAEEDSDWCERELNYHSGTEGDWRNKIADLEDLPVQVKPDEKLLGGKQYQRAIQFFGHVMIESLPDTAKLEDIAVNATGYLSGSLQRENWERAMVQITKSCMNKITHPGVNYLIKHVGSILRRLFGLALEDVKQGERNSSIFQLLPSSVEKYLCKEFDTLLWRLMEQAANQSHELMEAMYSTVNPNLPTFDPELVTKNDKDIEEDDVSQLAKVANKVRTLFSGASEAKSYLKNENRARASMKKGFLSDERTAMITKDELNGILLQSFNYIVALMEFFKVIFEFQVNHCLYEKFKAEFRNTFTKTVTDADWKQLCRPDQGMEKELISLKDQIRSLSESLHEVERLAMRM